MPVWLVGTTCVADPDAWQRDVEQAGATFSPHEGKVLFRGAKAIEPNGRAHRERIVVAECPDPAALRRWHDSVKCRSLIAAAPSRRRCRTDSAPNIGRLTRGGDAGVVATAFGCASFRDDAQVLRARARRLCREASRCAGQRAGRGTGRAAFRGRQTRAHREAVEQGYARQLDEATSDESTGKSEVKA